MKEKKRNSNEGEIGSDTDSLVFDDEVYHNDEDLSDKQKAERIRHSGKYSHNLEPISLKKKKKKKKIVICMMTT